MATRHRQLEVDVAFDPLGAIQDMHVFGEFGDINPSISDASTFTFMTPGKMRELFDHEVEGCYLYSRHWNPTQRALAEALAALEGTESAHVVGSGMAAIAVTILQLCSRGDEVVASRTVYGGTYALFANFLPRFGIEVRFVDTGDLVAVAAACSERTRVIYCEGLSNPLLEVADIPALANLAHRRGARLVVDNTFSPLLLAPVQLGADVVIHSLTKFINGTSDCVAGVVCGSREFIASLSDVNNGALMLLGPVLDSARAASILKNLHSLHLRMRQHSENALFLARHLEERGVRVHYPGLSSHPHHERYKRLASGDFGFGGVLTLCMPSVEQAEALMVAMQEDRVGFLAVSLGYFKTLFSSPSHSTSSEIPKGTQDEMGLDPAMVRISVGLDHDIARTWRRLSTCLDAVLGPRRPA